MGPSDVDEFLEKVFIANINNPRLLALNPDTSSLFKNVIDLSKKIKEQREVTIQIENQIVSHQNEIQSLEEKYLSTETKISNLKHKISNLWDEYHNLDLQEGCAEII